MEGETIVNVNWNNWRKVREEIKRFLICVSGRNYEANIMAFNLKSSNPQQLNNVCTCTRELIEQLLTARRKAPMKDRRRNYAELPSSSSQGRSFHQLDNNIVFLSVKSSQPSTPSGNHINNSCWSLLTFFLWPRISPRAPLLSQTINSKC